MINTLLAVKKGMTSGYDARGRRVGATILELTPNYVVAVKTKEGKDGYDALQLGMGNKKTIKKPQVGHFKKAGIDQKLRFLRESRIKDQGLIKDLKPGTELKLNQVFSKGDAVKVTGITKGRGFQGGVKRYGFSGGPKTHGQSDRHRAPGSIGQTTTPGRVYKGKRMAGHFGVEQVSYRGLEILSVDRKNNLLTVKGGVPGAVGGLVMVQNIGRIKGYIAPPEEKEDEEESAASVEEKEVRNVEDDSAMEKAATPEPVTQEEPSDKEKEEVKGEENAGE